MAYKVLGLDISSSTIGWALVEDADPDFRIVDSGYIKPLKSNKGEFVERLDDAYSKIFDLVEETKPDDLVIEDYARKFSSRKSSAQTITVLCAFNEVCGLAAYKASDKIAYRYTVTQIRSALGKVFGIKIKSKDEIFPVLAMYFSTKGQPIIELNRNRRIKAESGDVGDALAVAMMHIIKVREQKNG